MRALTEIIVHCTATRPEWLDGKPTADKVAEIKRWHVQGNGWSDIGYHWLIDRDGTVAEGRSMERNGAHVKGKNTGTVGISLVGGHGGSETDLPQDNFTAEQMAALRKLIGNLQFDYPSITKVTGHNQYAAKACPCFNVPAWWNEKPAKASGGGKKAAGGAVVVGGIIAAIVAFGCKIPLLSNLISSCGG